MSLDGDNVAVLSGVDPGTEGTLRRVPGGRVVYSIPYATGQYRTAHRLHACERKGVSGSWFQRTVSTGPETMTANSATTVGVAYGLTFKVGDIVAMFEPESIASKCCLGILTAVVRENLQVHVSAIDGYTGAYDTWSMPEGAIVQQVIPCEKVTLGTTPPYSFTVTTVSGFTVYHPCGLVPGMKVWVAANSSQYTPDTREAGARTVAKVVKSGSYWNVTLDEDVVIYGMSNGAAVDVALVAHRMAMETAGVEMIRDYDITQVSEGNLVLAFEGASGSSLVDHDWYGDAFDSVAGQIRFTQVGSRYFCTDGRSVPFQLLLETTQERIAYGVSGRYTACCRVGAEDVQTEDDTIFEFYLTTSGQISAGIHKAFIRLVDKREVPYGYSPPIFTHEETCDGADWLRIHPQSFLQSLSDDYGRYTHYEVWMTRAAGDEYYKVGEGSIPGMYCPTASAGIIPAATLSTKWGLSDTELIFQKLLATSAREKRPPPVCKFIHYNSGICFYGGQPSAAPSMDEKDFITGDEMLWFSRTDADEPENVPAENFKIVSSGLGRLHGFVDTRDAILALFDSGFVVIRRMGTYLVFTEDATHGCGCSQDDAFCSSRTHAVWWGWEGIWIYDPATMDMPMNLGLPIRDWVRGINSQMAADAEIKVTLGIDPERGVLYVNVTNGDTVAEGMYYSFGSTPSGFDWSAGTWCKREDWPVESTAYCRGVVTGMGYEMVASQKLSLLVACDWDNRPIAHGWAAINGTDKITDVLEGAVTAGQVISLAGTEWGDTDPHIHLTNTVAFTTTKSLIGACISFWRVDATNETVTEIGRRVIIKDGMGTATRVQLSSAITVQEGDRWVIGGIPWRVRFPPIRGEDPFVRKLALGAQIILGDIHTDAPSATSGHRIWLCEYDNLNSAPRSGNSSSAPIALSGYDRVALDVRAAGEVIEVEVSNLTGHFRADLLYCGVPVTSEGIFKSEGV